MSSDGNLWDSPRDDPALKEAWSAIDHATVGLKTSLITEEMQRLHLADLNAINDKNRGNENSLAIPAQRLDTTVKRTDEWASKLYEAYLQVWEWQGFAKSAEFVRAVCYKAIFPSIQARCQSALGELSKEENRTNRTPPNARARNEEFERRMERLKTKWSIKLDLEARECKYRETSKTNIKQCIASVRLPRSAEHLSSAAECSQNMVDLLNLPAGFQSPDPVEGNPFSAADPRHAVWQDATRRSEQKLLQFNAAYMGAVRDLPLPQSPAEARRLELARMVCLAVGKFDIWAERGINVIWSDEAVQAFDAWLATYAEEWLKCLNAYFPPEMETGWLLAEIRSRLIERMEFWKSEARRYVAEQKEATSSADGAVPADDGGFSVSDDYSSVTYQGQNIILTRNQAAMLRVLHQEYLAGHHAVSKDRLLSAIENETSQVKDSWKGSALWKTLIVSPRKSYYCLNLPAHHGKS